MPCRLQCDGIAPVQADRLRSLCRTYLTHLHDNPEATVYDLFVMGRAKLNRYNEKFLLKQAIKANQKLTAETLKKDSIAFLEKKRQEELRREVESCDGSDIGVESLCAAMAETPLEETVVVIEEGKEEEKE